MVFIKEDFFYSEFCSSYSWSYKVLPSLLLYWILFIIKHMCSKRIDVSVTTNIGSIFRFVIHTTLYPIPLVKEWILWKFCLYARQQTNKCAIVMTIPASLLTCTKIGIKSPRFCTIKHQKRTRFLTEFTQEKNNQKVYFVSIHFVHLYIAFF